MSIRHASNCFPHPYNTIAGACSHMSLLRRLLAVTSIVCLITVSLMHRVTQERMQTTTHTFGGILIEEQHLHQTPFYQTPFKETPF